MSTIIIGVDASERSEDAIAFGRQLAEPVSAHVIVTNAFPYSDSPGRGANEEHRTAMREEALVTARKMREQLGGVVEDRSHIRVVADPSPAKALDRLARSEHAALLIVGSTHTGRAGRVLPGSTGERLLHGAPCSVAAVPTDYREHASEPIRRIGVAYDESDEAKAALAGAAALARALGAELEVIGVATTEYMASPAIMGVADVASLQEDVERAVQHSLDEAVAGLGESVTARTRRLTGHPAELLVARSAELDLLVMGSRGYGPLRSVVVGGVSGRVLREAHCPMIVVPRGVESPLETLLETAATDAPG